MFPVRVPFAERVSVKSTVWLGVNVVPPNVACASRDAFVSVGRFGSLRFAATDALTPIFERVTWSGIAPVRSKSVFVPKGVFWVTFA
jgi:hypothetical protein